MAQNNNKKKSGNDGAVNLVDLFFYLLSYWYWFVLFALIGVGIAGYKYAKSTFIYRSYATIVIKDPANSRSTARLDTYNNMINRSNVTNEILEFKSKKLMSEVVQRLDANVNYRTQVKLRQLELYTNSPVRVLFSE